MAGIEAATGTYVVMADADGSYDFGAILPFIEKLRQGYSLVMGCRFPRGHGTIMPEAMPWSHRWLGNPILTGVGRLFFRSPVSDFNCGLRAFRRNTITALDLRTTGMEFASEMVIRDVERRADRRDSNHAVQGRTDPASPSTLRRLAPSAIMPVQPILAVLDPGCVFFLEQLLRSPAFRPVQTGASA
jgi:glycosyltransferase involved in cell wall biosynthesis